MARKNYLREPCLKARTTTTHLRTTDFRLLHFISQISYPLAFLSRFPSPLFLSTMEDLPRGDYSEQGIKQKDAAILFSPNLLLVPLSLHPSFRPVLFMESCSHFLKDFHLIFFFSSLSYAMLLSLVFPPPPKGSAICNGSCATIT